MLLSHLQLAPPTVSIANAAAARTVVVMGVARGGTSAVSGLLHIMGISMVESKAPLDFVNNEDAAFLGHGGDREIFTHRHRAAELAAYLQSIRKHIAMRTRSGRRWGWKDPLVSHYIADVWDGLDRPCVVLVTRDLVATSIREIMQAEHRTPDTMLDQMEVAQGEYGAAAEFLRSVLCPILFVSYERMIRHAQATVASFGDFLGIAIDDATLERCVGYIAPDKLDSTIDGLADQNQPPATKKFMERLNSTPDRWQLPPINLFMARAPVDEDIKEIDLALGRQKFDDALLRCNAAWLKLVYQHDIPPGSVVELIAVAESGMYQFAGQRVQVNGGHDFVTSGRRS